MGINRFIIFSTLIVLMISFGLSRGDENNGDIQLVSQEEPSRMISALEPDYDGTLEPDYDGNCNVYTKIANTHCDGWAYTSFEDCKQKCINNALPESCDSGESSKNCAFAVWDDNPDFAPGWCQLAEDGVCNKENTQPGDSWGQQVKIWEKPGTCYLNANVYTKIPNTPCDGWAKTSLEDCKKKCINNELPSDCSEGKPTSGCKFVFWHDNPDWQPGWCQLAEDGCMTQSEYNSNSYDSYIIWEKPEMNNLEKRSAKRCRRRRVRKCRGKGKGRARFCYYTHTNNCG